ncbi:FliO/MopB family protein [Paenibacillus thermoaerophilus]|uniref:FliO/MopB family protein n=1 Tax=Paenibacillus thermoaerophilus TaxID=1215385 RepID=A0ABW2V2J9_9BACL|nr:flagellar biosynthetic protein FliO [Paenibacillus thermoaerophilus]TMV13805.1 hypothetical protein FE781_11445 [Paenibacillus thermoaerophilus]
MRTLTYEWLAASPEPETAPMDADSGLGMIGTLFQLFGYLAIILLLFYIAVKWVARSRSRQYGKAGRALTPLGGLPFGPNKSIQVVRLGDRLYIVGVADRITLLDTITDPDEVEAIQQLFEREWTARPNWLPTNWLGRSDRRELSRDVLDEGDQEGAAERSFHELFESKLRGVGSRTKQVEQWLQGQPQEERSKEP